jgi:Tc5 transposase DNA-binding domain
MLCITEDKFKASSGWVENFKHRHGIRGGVWHGEGRNTKMARALGAGTMGIDEDKIEHHPVFRTTIMGRIEAHLAATPPGVEYRHPLSVGPVWSPRHDQPSPAFSLMNRSLHEPPSHNPHDHHESSMHLSHLPLSPHEPTNPSPQSNSGHSPSSYDMGIYPSVRSMPPREPQTLADAEDALNKFISFIETRGQHVLSPEERQHLEQIKSTFTQAGSGAPFDRNSR